VPDLVTSLVIGLSLTLLGVVALLVHDVRKRGKVESALADALAFRKAMEDSVMTGLRARDLHGRTSYVNPAFCAMVGYDGHELIDRDLPPYWPLEQIAEYQTRQQRRFAGSASSHPREAFETTFVRKNGERFPVMVFEAPLLDSAGRHTGWMSAVLELTAQRRVEEIARQQQERLQATARLATAGEMASLLSHELNQPLSAIAAYATGSLNMMDAQTRADEQGGAPDADLWPMLHQASQRIAEQAERAGRVIKSVHDFVRRRENAREVVRVDALIDAILPLARLQARKSDTRLELDLGSPMPKVRCDRAMVEQVLLNLTRNGIQAMQGAGSAAPPVLTLRVRQTHAQWVRISVSDRGPGVDDDVAKKLFTPFFTTRADGMGLGLSVCRSIIEQHGGALDFANLRDSQGNVLGAEFRFTLPAAPVDPSGSQRSAGAPSAAVVP
jgi:two-component system sensor histidine kinase DctS